jgi:DNA polymerase-3 subunit alpha
MGRDTPLAACLEPIPGYEDGYQQAAQLREMVAEDPDVARVVQVAKGLEGLRRQDGIHAAAVVISRDPLTEYLPIQRKPDPGPTLLRPPSSPSSRFMASRSLACSRWTSLGCAPCR